MIYKANDKNLINEKEFLDEYWNTYKKLLFDKETKRSFIYKRSL